MRSILPRKRRIVVSDKITSGSVSKDRIVLPNFEPRKANDGIRLSKIKGLEALTHGKPLPVKSIRFEKTPAGEVQIIELVGGKTFSRLSDEAMITLGSPEVFGEKGYLIFQEIESPLLKHIGNALYLWSTMTPLEHRRKGYGRMLIERAEKEAKKRNAKIIYGCTSRDNHAMLGILKSRGWRELLRREAASGVFAHTDPSQVIMIKELEK